MFYGSFDKKTPLEEIARVDCTNPSLISLGTFELLDEIRVIDFTKIKTIPSIFDADNRHLRFNLSFLNSFLADFIKPIIKDGKEPAVPDIPSRPVFRGYEEIGFRKLFGAIA
jgi:hypothetical protein